MERIGQLDDAEATVAAGRLARWSNDDRSWFDQLPQREQDVVLLLLAHFDAHPANLDEALTLVTK